MTRVTRSSAAAAAEEPAGSTWPAWSRSVKEVEQHFGVSAQQGLSQQQVAAQRARFGFNELEKEQGKPLWKLVLEQFDDPLVKVRARRGARRLRARGRIFRPARPGWQRLAPACRLARRASLPDAC